MMEITMLERKRREMAEKALTKLNFPHRARDPQLAPESERSFHEEKWVIELFKQN